MPTEQQQPEEKQTQPEQKVGNEKDSKKSVYT